MPVLQRIFLITGEGNHLFFFEDKINLQNNFSFRFERNFEGFFFLRKNN